MFNSENSWSSNFIYYFVTNQPNEHHCFSPETMDWFYNNWVTAINDLKPVGKTFSHMIILEDDFLGQEFQHRKHYGRPMYGETVTCPCDPCIIVNPDGSTILIDCECC